MLEAATAPWSLPSSSSSCLTDKHLNINEASKACGLSPSVLRIWELRYGWPNPKRKANGYRSYSPHLVEDLKRMAELVNEGTPIRHLILDGLPQWPRSDSAPEPVQRQLDYTRSLPCSGGPSERDFRDELLRSLETHRSGTILEILQRAAWQLRQKDELDTVLAPAIVGLAELQDIARPLPGNHSRSSIRHAVEGRCRQLLRSMDTHTYRVLPLHPEDTALAWITCLALARHQCQAVVCQHRQPDPKGTLLVVSDGILSGASLHHAHAIIGSIEADDRRGIGDILSTEAFPSWL
ncbi:MAG: MerR family transcriptional regulator [Planctomycetota bacterium]|nr:MAG: MerR family transcriptional regulator [Planctomycetota bacterium]